MIEWLIPMLLPAVIQAGVGLVMIGGERERRKQLAKDITKLYEDVEEKADRVWVEGEFVHVDRRMADLKERIDARRAAR